MLSLVRFVKHCGLPLGMKCATSIHLPCLAFKDTLVDTATPAMTSGDEQNFHFSDLRNDKVKILRYFPVSLFSSLVFDESLFIWLLQLVKIY